MSNVTEFSELIPQIRAYVDPLKALQVTSDESSRLAMSGLQDIKSLQKLVEERRVELKAPMLASIRRLDDQAKTVAGPLNEAEEYLKKQYADYAAKKRAEQEAHERRLAEEQRRAQDELRRKAEIEAKELRERQERDRAAAAEAQELFGADDDGLAERQAREREALAAQEQINREAVAVDYGRAKQDAQEIKPSGTKLVWKYTVTDLDAIPVAYLKREPDGTMLLAAARKGLKIAGVKFFQTEEVSVRTRR